MAAFVFLLWCFFLFSLGLDRQPNADYLARRVTLAQKLDGGVAVIFAATEAEGPNATSGFRQDNNFFYLSGLTEPGAALVVAPPSKRTPRSLTPRFCSFRRAT